MSDLHSTADAAGGSSGLRMAILGLDAAIDTGMIARRALKGRQAGGNELPPGFPLQKYLEMKMSTVKQASLRHSLAKLVHREAESYTPADLGIAAAAPVAGLAGGALLGSTIGVGQALKPVPSGKGVQALTVLGTLAGTGKRDGVAIKGMSNATKALEKIKSGTRRGGLIGAGVGALGGAGYLLAKKEASVKQAAMVTPARTDELYPVTPRVSESIAHGVIAPAALQLEQDKVKDVLGISGRGPRHPILFSTLLSAAGTILGGALGVGASKLVAPDNRKAEALGMALGGTAGFLGTRLALARQIVNKNKELNSALRDAEEGRLRENAAAYGPAYSALQVA